MNCKKGLLIPFFKDFDLRRILLGNDVSTNNKTIVPITDMQSTNLDIDYDITTDKDEDKDYSLKKVDDMPKREKVNITNNISKKNSSKNSKKKSQNKKVNSSYKIQQNKNDEDKIKEKGQNKLSILNDCYKKLNGLLSTHSFIEISENILKIMNDIEEEDNNKNRLYEEVKNITSKIQSKENIIIILLNILSQKFLKNNTLEEMKEEEKDKTFEKNEPNTKINSEEQALQNEIERNSNLIFFDCSSNIFKFKQLLKTTRLGPYYYKDNEEIFSYSLQKIKDKQKPPVFRCNKIKNKCKAKCIFNDNFDIKLVGIHNHSEGNLKNLFYIKYPFLNQKDWKQIQILKNKEKVYVVRLG